jgi:hypothetical protein
MERIKEMLHELADCCDELGFDTATLQDLEENGRLCDDEIGVLKKRIADNFNHRKSLIQTILAKIEKRGSS